MLFDWIKSVPTRASDIWQNVGRLRDLLADPATSSGESLKSIVQRLSWPLQRIIALILLVLALLFGVDIGISYQKALSGPLAASVSEEPAKALTPIRRAISPPSERRSRATRTLRTAQPTTPSRRATKPRRPARTVEPARRDADGDDPYRVYQPGTLTSSGINGY